MTIGDLFNAPTEFKLGDEVFLVREPDQVQQGEFQKWIQQLVFDDINSRTYQTDTDREMSIRLHNRDCGAGIYEWGGKCSIERIQTQRGLTKLISIICRDQGLTDKKAEQLVREQAAGLLQVFRDKVAAEEAEGAPDPKGLEAIMSKLGSPSAFFLSVLLTHPLISPLERSRS